MQHSLVLICSRKLMMIFTGAFFLLIFLDTALGSYHYKTVTMSLSKKIKSPGYPHKNYERNTNYTWYVMASDDTEEISIEITMDIHGVLGIKCDDYLQIQEVNPSGRNFNLFKQCGKQTTNRKARGNRLLITLISNYDDLTSKGFQLTLKVSKVGTTLTTRTTSTQSTTTETRTTASTVKTTVLKVVTTLTTRTTSTQSTTTKTMTTAPTVKTTGRNIFSKTRSTKSTLTKRTKSTLLPSTTKPLKASTVEVLMSNTTTTTKKMTESTTSATPLTTRNMITTTPNMTLTTNATTLLTKSRTLLKSTQIASTSRTTDGNRSNKESTTIWLPSSQSVETQSTSYQKSNIFASLETVILLIGLGVLEVTLIVVGVLAVQRYRRKRNSNNSRHASKRIDDDANTFKRQNSFGETNVYDEINIDDVKEEKEEENPYKELPEGVYDTTLKRRSYLKVVGERKSKYSRGSIINMFRTSSTGRKTIFKQVRKGGLKVT